MKEVETGLSGDREANMVAFAVEALKLLKKVIKGDAKSSAEASKEVSSNAQELVDWEAKGGNPSLSSEYVSHPLRNDHRV